MSDHDEYDSFDLSNFTEEDFAHIDAVLQIEDGDNVGLEKGGPTITIEVEHNVSESKTAFPTSNSKQEMSPYQRYRWNKTLSVTDLVSLAWCEVQFDYGLRQKRFKSIDQRPASFVSSKGKEIFVEKQVAMQNDRTTKKGKSVHKKLEREIWPEEVRVDIATEEERWALRLVNMLAGLDRLMTLGCTREMPVFGVLHEQVIVGVIDEISRKMSPQAADPIASKRASDFSQVPTTSKRMRRTSSPSEPPAADDDESVSTLTNGRPSTPPAYPPSFRQHPYTLHLLDTKTRRSPSLPQHEDTLASRLQLMLYHRLLTNLMSTFDFSSIWDRLKLNSLKPFSTRFILQAGLLLDPSKSAAPSCLDDLTRVWMHAVSQLDVVGVDHTLQIQYRTQPKATRQERKGKTGSNAMEIVSIHEEQAIAQAIAESLKDIGGDAVGDAELARALAASLDDHESEVLGTSVKDDVGVSEAGADQVYITLETSVDASDGSAPPGETPSADVSKIIGTKAFPVDDSLLDTYLIDVLQWWHGVRPPRGVEMAQARRCFTCEYCEGCEWREAKATEATKMMETRPGLPSG